MANNIINYLTQAFMAPTAMQAQNVRTVEQVKEVKSTNPFSNNPFVYMSAKKTTMETYAKNCPVKGGYFAGYYNNKPNIVGQRLFLEV